jgi:hypothetical protein
MASGSEHLRPHLHEYLVAHTTPPDALLRDLITETAERFPGNVIHQIGPEQGTFMTMLASLMGARRAIEVGTFTPGHAARCPAVPPSTSPSSTRTSRATGSRRCCCRSVTASRWRAPDNGQRRRHCLVPPHLQWFA